jgi:signal transduction histidine kinase
MTMAGFPPAPGVNSAVVMALAAQNSRQRLAASIERVLRSEMPSRASQAELAGSIDRTLLREAWRNELTLAHLRAATAVAFTTLYLVAHFWPTAAGFASDPLYAGLFSAFWSAATLGLLLALRRGWYRPWLRLMLPAADALVILVVVLLLNRGVGFVAERTSAAIMLNVTALCVFLAFSGALRLTRSAAQLTTTLAIAVFFFTAYVSRLDLLHVAFIGTIVLVAGMWGIGVTGLVRRVVMHEVGHLTLERMYAEAEQAILAREETLSMVAHDLRNPLSTIIMGASTLLSLPDPDGQHTKLLTIVKRAGDRMNRLIQDLLSISRIESGRLGVDARPTDVAALVEEAMDMLRPIAAEQSCRLDTEVATGLPAVQADAARVLQVLSNLVGNAIKFTPKGGRIVIGASRVGGKVLCSVTDTGPGIPAEQLPHIFDRFWQARHADRRGIGLGLAIAKGIVEAHGEQIWAVSEPGNGSSFLFALPLAEATPASAPPAPSGVVHSGV